MAAEPRRIPLGGVWYRHVRGGGDPLGLPAGDARGGWQRAREVGALYLADSTQWPQFHAVGERLARAGLRAVLDESAARPGHRCLCVFAPALDRLTALDHERVDVLPAPPRGMRT